MEEESRDTMKTSKVLILGAGGQIAQQVIPMLQGKDHLALTLFLRRASQVKGKKSAGAEVIEGDVMHAKELNDAMNGQDIVYANLAGEVDKMASHILQSMEKHQVKRLIFVTSLGIYDEVPGAFGEWNKSMIGKYIGPYKKAADIIEASGLDYTIIRPAWLTDDDEIDYELTQKGHPFKGTEVSRKSVAAFIADLIEHPKKEIGKSVGINKPNTDGDKPAFY
ncbi:uncharacterized protein YbjT (DUF2867 family) [Chitinophaga dinghuensis]|uniref:Uncharacterized protein YbjT (DUF2867 family) n=2 Tax=Chitinophaga dinghuensis TaxID=1539050 RepID=A0A327VXZ0_9BACT|nr:uncharacterized protein YbjT (DUF2867 family) [Chitinophaga dinghuensis]